MPYLALLLLLFRRFLLSIMAFAFTAFISPTSVTLAEGFDLAKVHWHRLFADVANYQTVTILVLLVILGLLWAYNRSFAEALSIILTLVVALVLLLAVPTRHVPVPLRLASSNERANEHRLAVRASSYGLTWDVVLITLIVLAIVFVIVMAVAVRDEVTGALQAGAYLLTVALPWLLGIAVAVIATIALFPYVHFIYPVPHRNYYVEVTHAMWLPAERIVLKTHHIYYGYVLSSDGAWYTVLLVNSRTIAYLPTDEVVGRSVCQPIMTDQPKQYPPLIPWLYHAPAPLPACALRDVTPSITSFLSHGESLKEISSATHRSIWSLISVTNSHQNFWLSATLRRYERAHDWGAPAPVGQQFWYYPRTGAGSRAG